MKGIQYGTLTERYVTIERVYCPYEVRDAIKKLPGFLRVAHDQRGKMEDFPEVKELSLIFYFMGSMITLEALRLAVIGILEQYGAGELS